MLWEAHDPRGEISTRFGFRDAAAAGQWVVSTLDAHWGVTVDVCERIVMSDRNALAWVDTSSGRLIAKWSIAPERFGRLAALAKLTSWLGGNGLPVSAPIATTDGRLQVEVDGVSLCLQHEIPGALLDSAELCQVHSAGEVLARLHEALARYPGSGRIAGVAPPSRTLAARVTAWLDTRSASVPRAARAALRQLIADAPMESMSTQLVHGDFRSANVLCVESAVAAVIDFEEARIDHRIAEVARSAVLLGTRFHDWGPVSAEVHARFLDGYQAVSPLTRAEAAWWDVLVLWCSLAMIPDGEDSAGWRAAALSLLSALGQTGHAGGDGARTTPG